MKLTSENVRTVMLDCLFTPEELEGAKNLSEKEPEAIAKALDAIVVKGVVRRFGLHKGRVMKHRAEIEEMLRQLPKDFHEGMSFLKAPFDYMDNQWGEQRSAEDLLVLGMAIGNVKQLNPDAMTSVLPGGVPYYQVTI